MKMPWRTDRAYEDGPVSRELRAAGHILGLRFEAGVPLTLADQARIIRTLAELLYQSNAAQMTEAELRALAAAVLDPRLGQQPVSVYRARAERLARAVDEFLCRSKA